MSRAAWLLLACAASCCAQTKLVSGIGNFIHAVGDLDRSVRFYRDVVGMDVPRPAGDFQTTEAILKMYDAAGGRFRVANAQIPGSPMRVEMVEFQGVDRKPVERRWGVAGTSVLMLTVTDLAAVEARVKAAGALVLEKVRKACDGRGIVIADPDGFAVMVVERAAASATTSNFTSMRFGYLVNGDAMVKGPFAALGLAAGTRKASCKPVEDELLHAQASIVTLPAGFEVWLVKGKAAKSGVVVRPRDPGAAVLRFMVTDVDAAVQALGQPQVSAVQTLAPAGLRAVIVRAPDDLLIQVVK